MNFVLQCRRAMTLFELLVTMTIITIMSGAILYSLSANRTDGDIDQGLETLHSMIRVARSQALANGTSSRLIINFDENDPDNFLRQIGVMIKDETTTGYWKAIDRGALLPRGVSIVPRSKVDYTDDWPTGEFDGKSIYKKSRNLDDLSVFKYEYPLKDSVSETAGGEWLVFQFSPSGRLEGGYFDGSGNPPVSNKIVIGFSIGEGSETVFKDPMAVKAVGFKRSGASFTIGEVAKI